MTNWFAPCGGAQFSILVAEVQPRVVEEVSRQIEAGDRRIIGLMVESNLLAGRQDLITGAPLVYGRSITDGCIDWDTSVGVLERVACAVERRRAGVGSSHMDNA